MRVFTRIFLACLAAVMAVASCAETEQLLELRQDGVQQREFKACLSIPTKTDISLGTTGKVKWEAGDAISILYGSSNIRAELSPEYISEDGLTAIFVADVAPAESYRAVYPYAETNALEGDRIICAGPAASQDGSFAGAHVAVADYVAEESAFHFHNVVGMISFKLADPQVASVSLRGRDGEQLHGAMAVRCAQDALETAWCSDGGTVLRAGTDGTGEYWMGTMGARLEKGFSMSFYKADGSLYGTASSSKALDLATGRIVRLGGLDSRIAKESGKVAAFPYVEAFDSSQGDFTLNNKVLPSKLSYVWKLDPPYGMKASAYVGKKNYAAESWLISPFIDLTSAERAVLSFSHAANKMSASPSAYFSVMASADGQNWTRLEVPTWPSGSDWTFVESGVISLARYIGGKVRIAFVYTSTTSVCGTWEIKNFAVTDGEMPVYEPAAAFYEASVYGIYNCSSGAALKTYARRSEQTATGQNHFSIIDPNLLKYINITGIPAEVKEGDSFTVKLDDKFDSSRSGSYEVSVGKISGRTIWLYGESGTGFIIKK